MEGISGRQIKINTKFYDFKAFHSYIRDEHKKLHRALESDMTYQLKSPLGEPLPQVLISAMYDKEFSDAFSVMHALSKASQAEYDGMYSNAVKDVTPKPTVSSSTSSNM
jgi:hypothetical protein